jgi:hypothetical protein
MIYALYTVIYLTLGSIITGVISGLDSSAFKGKDGGGFCLLIVAIWPLAGVGVVLFLAHVLAEHSVNVVKKFMRLSK